MLRSTQPCLGKRLPETKPRRSSTAHQHKVGSTTPSSEELNKMCQSHLLAEQKEQLPRHARFNKTEFFAPHARHEAHEMADDLTWMIRRGGLSQAHTDSADKSARLHSHAPTCAATLDRRSALLTDLGNEQGRPRSFPHSKPADRPSGGGERLRPGTPPAHAPPHHAPPWSRAADPCAPAAPLGPLPPPLVSQAQW